eukprot:11223745-Lingulodinium_polyedra.AAC.1
MAIASTRAPKVQTPGDCIECSSSEVYSLALPAYPVDAQDRPDVVADWRACSRRLGRVRRPICGAAARLAIVVGQKA